MANTFIPKRSSVAGKVPLTTDLQIGELAINLADKKIYTKDANNAVVQLNNAAGVSSFNTRTGAVTLQSADVAGALGYTPANVASPAFTGTPTAPTAANGTDTQQIATTAFVNSVLAAYGIGTSDFTDYTGDLNALVKGGLYLANGTNLPLGVASFVIVMANGSGNVSQLAIPQGTARLLVRSTSLGSWSSWREVAYLDSGVVSANGIKFPAAQVASADANTLDDYEEGTWTPIPRVTSGAISSYVSHGTYTKIGRLVFVRGTITVSNNGNGGSGFYFSLPFASSVNSAGTGRENALTGYTVQLYMYGGATECNINYNNGYPVLANGYSFEFAITYMA